MSKTSKLKRPAPVRVQPVIGPLPCPFCGVPPREYDGDHVLSHAIGCFFTQQYAQEMWIVGRRRMEWWNKRANE